MKKDYIVNSRGERELFSFDKVYRSSKRAGASDSLAKKIASKVEKNIYPDIKTSKIYSQVKRLLKQSPALSMKFSLKQAMRKLGPSGFDFEKYIAGIFEKNGYKTKINQIIPGKCIAGYEIDFLAEKDKFFHIGECKYHTFAGARVDLKIALYNYARYLDIFNNSKFKNSKTIIVTNTKFTSEAISYCECYGVGLLGWRYPRDKGLEHLIEKHKLYPVTILPSFKAHYKNIFAENRMMMALDLLKFSPSQIVKKLGLSSNEIKRLVQEASVLLE
ncbi:MAG: restriction endonuclease [Patescibacteria group bacterium]|nr:restriction endonuclease [Patescibacteria group bacterium]